jgi:hypothetical protein
MDKDKSVEFSLIGLAGLLAEHGFRVVAGEEVHESEYRPEKRRVILTVALKTPLPPFDNGLMDFMEKRTVFEPEALTKMEELYAAYLDYHGFDQNEVARGEILSRHRFIRLILETYSQFVSQRIAHIDGKPARCFSGLKLRSLEELAETGTVQEVKV